MKKITDNTERNLRRANMLDIQMLNIQFLRKLSDSAYRKDEKEQYQAYRIDDCLSYFYLRHNMFLCHEKQRKHQ